MGFMRGLLANDLLRYGSAGSGLLLCLFLIAHLAGLVPALIAPAAFEAYASSLHHASWLPLLEIALLATAILPSQQPFSKPSAIARPATALS